MNLGKILGVSLTLTGIISGVVTFGVTGAIIGNTELPGFLWIISGITFIMGVFIFLMSIEKDDESHAEIGLVKVFSENEKRY